MRVELHDHFRRVVSHEATRVVIYDAAENAIAVVISQSPGQCVVSHIGSPGFDQIMEALGIRRTVVDLI
jgi:hypothetical protein